MGVSVRRSGQAVSGGGTQGRGRIWADGECRAGGAPAPQLGHVPATTPSSRRARRQHAGAPPWGGALASGLWQIAAAWQAAMSLREPIAVLRDDAVVRVRVRSEVYEDAGLFLDEGVQRGVNTDHQGGRRQGRIRSTTQIISSQQGKTRDSSSSPTTWHRADPTFALPHGYCPNTWPLLPREHMSVGKELFVTSLRTRQGVLVFPRGQVEETLRIWADSDRAGDVRSRKSCSRGYIQRNGGTCCSWCNTQANAALSAGQAELISAAQGIS